MSKLEMWSEFVNLSANNSWIMINMRVIVRGVSCMNKRVEFALTALSEETTSAANFTGNR